ncbi:MAG: transcriptional repressor LexA [Oscillospiraceae bacterium]|nr:transcriptional repressor LexA [Oscillospiraceae bacterium]
MPRTSNKQAEILEYLRQFLSENGYAPSVREICAAVGLRSTSSVHYHLSQLKRRGLIEMEDNKNRTVTVPLERADGGRIPIVGIVTAGLPILAVENIDGYLPWEGEEDCFALRVRGESMIGAGIFDGDLVVIRPQNVASNGDIVLALLDDEATIKRFYRNEGEVWLLPENDAFSPIDGRYARILGKVKALMREY